MYFAFGGPNIQMSKIIIVLLHRKEVFQHFFKY